MRLPVTVKTPLRDRRAHRLGQRLTTAGGDVGLSKAGFPAAGSLTLKGSSLPSPCAPAPRAGDAVKIADRIVPVSDRMTIN